MPFGYHDVPRASASVPACGPVHGGTAVTVHGSGFGNGTAYRCRFGGATVAASYDAAADALADALAARGSSFEDAVAAAALGCSSSALIKLLAQEKA
ncbi:MAG: IPT/TIG domain-containing protein, partial [Pseudomonadota bacterium]|nr:IPT/TIG domain-containing protein [Pseudomonadota bacterium]